MKERIDARAFFSAYSLVLRTAGGTKDTIWCSLLVHAGTLEESISEANRLAEELQFELEHKNLQRPSIVKRAEPVPVMSRHHRRLSTMGTVIGVIVLGTSLVTAILHVAAVRRRTPPPLPGQQPRGNDSVSYEY